MSAARRSLAGLMVRLGRACARVRVCVCVCVRACVLACSRAVCRVPRAAAAMQRQCRKTNKRPVSCFTPLGGAGRGGAGLDVVRQILTVLPGLLEPCGTLLMEVDESHPALIEAMLRDEPAYSKLR